jgi:16S rRNA processing protein RimM
MSNLLAYLPWQLVRGDSVTEVRPAEGKVHGDVLVVRLPLVETREAAEALKGCMIHVSREQLPPPELGEYYRIDLMGLRVVSVEGFEFGRVVDIMETGANDVLVVEGDREYLIPFVQRRYVQHVDIVQGFIRVDWDPDF